MCDSICQFVFHWRSSNCHNGSKYYFCVGFDVRAHYCQSFDITRLLLAKIMPEDFQTKPTSFQQKYSHTNHTFQLQLFFSGKIAKNCILPCSGSNSFLSVRSSVAHNILSLFTTLPNPHQYSI